MASSSAPAVSVRKVHSKAQWERRLNQASISKDDLNRLVMDYLVIEGYKDAAERFAAESGLSPQVDLESIENRMLIRNAIQRGDIENAIGKVNELDPEILDNNHLLFFHLQQQRLIELIRVGRVDEALLFAAEELAPRAEEHLELLPELERTMALLAFDLPAPALSLSLDGDGKWEDGGAAAASSGLLPESVLLPPPHIASLLSASQRLQTAGELNAAILASQAQGRVPKLPQMLMMMKYGEDLLSVTGPGRTEFPTLDIRGGLRGGRSGPWAGAAAAAAAASKGAATPLRAEAGTDDDDEEDEDEDMAV
ncbi:hypothetical protein OC842_002928 [Tilletia horrida]|uniref:CTLH domain-containing protein n=1 Tax=Tilletia horrida TaxID=155126 RepID=A0AAN6JL76_9BASI|nr:hypothetical protein OC842_002928 [Tilletia horrida]